MNEYIIWALLPGETENWKEQIIFQTLDPKEAARAIAYAIVKGYTNTRQQVFNLNNPACRPDFSKTVAL